MTREEQVTVQAIKELLEAQELHRKELRAADDHWRERMEEKTDKMYARIDELAECVADVPCVMDAKIAACRDEREELTREAVMDSQARHSLSKLAADWRTWVAFGLGIGAYFIGRG